MIFKVFSIYFLISFVLVFTITNNFKNSNLIQTLQTNQTLIK